MTKGLIESLLEAFGPVAVTGTDVVEAQEFKAAMEGLDRSEDRPWERDRSDSLSAPRRPRMSFSEVPEELLSLDLNDIALPPMNSKAEVKKSHYYSNV